MWKSILKRIGGENLYEEQPYIMMDTSAEQIYENQHEILSFFSFSSKEKSFADMSRTFFTFSDQKHCA